MTISSDRKSEVLYLYGVTPTGSGLKIRGSIDGASKVEALEASGLAAWYSRVSREAFGDSLASNMENLEWLAGASVRHQRVVSQLAAKLTILPARFGTVFSSEESLKRHLQKESERLEATLVRFQDTEEWGIKVFFQERAAAPQPVAVSSGRDYLRAKAATFQQKKRGELDPEVVEFARELQSIASEAAAAGKVSSGQNNLEWQASFLVRRKDLPKWNETLKRYAARWSNSREIQCTGPWPPYSFV